MEDDFIAKLDHLRAVLGWPMIVTSGYRSLAHSAEINKPNGGGYHTKGIAADIKVYRRSKHSTRYDGCLVASISIPLHMRVDGY